MNFSAYIYEKPSLQAIPFQSPPKIPQKSSGAVLGGPWKRLSAPKTLAGKPVRCLRCLKRRTRPPRESQDAQKLIFQASKPLPLQASKPSRLQACMPTRAEAGCAKRKQGHLVGCVNGSSRRDSSKNDIKIKHLLVCLVQGNKQRERKENAKKRVSTNDGR